MEINNSLMSAYAFQMKPREPSEPIAPPGGNVENRQPPPEPPPPTRSTGMDDETYGASRTGSLLDLFA